MDTTLQQQEPNISSPEPAAKLEPRRRGWWRMLTLGAVIVLGGMLAMEMRLRGQRQVGLAETAPPAQSDVLSVQVVTLKRSAASSELLLPGNVQAVQEASIFARTNGYVKRRLVDIGDRVSAGQLLAEIEAPEVDQELLQARASLLQARATLGQARASLKQMQANVQQARANVQQVQANVDLARITAERWRQLEQETVDLDAILNRTETYSLPGRLRRFLQRSIAVAAFLPRHQLYWTQQKDPVPHPLRPLIA